MLDLSSLKPDNSIITQQSQMLKAMACTLEREGCVYLSGPITTGKRFLDWHIQIGRGIFAYPDKYKATLRSDVIEKNETAIFSLAKKIRDNNKFSVIEPGSLVMKNWTQQDYITFWVRVLEEFATSVYMLDGWQFSAGCTTEFRFAISRNILTFSECGVPISPEIGEGMIGLAVEEIRKISDGDKCLESLANNLVREGKTIDD